ncbi:hypothetical protein EU546_00775 [Candidatus Thorarchaeota archaeon]|nr:MAG: hypothetical protein EU546_00775 [Candidatus Thorarchaeota archaeon]
MLAVFLVFGALALSTMFYLYAIRTEKARGDNGNARTGKTGRDMWAATLLDCDYEPAKVRFGPAKAIPAGTRVLHVSHKEEFSKHMASK